MQLPNQPDPVKLTLTEHLAADRTDLANERTLLDYVRTALALIISGTGFSELVASPVLRLVFLFFLPLGVVVLAVGVVRFRQRRKALNQYRH
ncbi:MAG: DUF202 domain-containing protein [Bacteroidetes bacterium]|nr:DUF202 domain-containing protein [Fibrella sp.]